MLKKIALFISAFVPLYLLLLIKIGLQLANHNLHFNVLNCTMLSLLGVLAATGIITLATIINSKSDTQVNIDSATNVTENYFLGYFSLFVLFALTFSIEYVSMAVTFVLIQILIGIVYIKNDLFYINPTLNILGYSVYEVKTSQQNASTTYVFSKSKLLSALVKGKTVSSNIVLVGKKLP